MPVKSILQLLMVALAIASTMVPALADDTYPTKQVRIISPYAAGGTPDIVARELAAQLTQRLKQSFFVENRTGANGTIASDSVVASPPDGYTLLLASDGPILITPLLNRSGNYLKRLVPVNLSAETAFVLLARTNLDVHTLANVVSLAKKEPLTFGSAGFGSQHHLAGELFKRRAGINLVHVPYKGATEAITDLVGKRIDLMFGGVPPALPYIAAKSVRPIAVTSEKRNTKLPSVPTFAEEGYPGFRVFAFFGIMAPAGTPKAVIDKLNGAISDALKSPDLMARFDKVGADIVNLGPAAFAERLKSDQTMWAKLIQQAGLVSK